jgi:hypothetical protein
MEVLSATFYSQLRFSRSETIWANLIKKNMPHPVKGNGIVLLRPFGRMGYYLHSPHTSGTFPPHSGTFRLYPMYFPATSPVILMQYYPKNDAILSLIPVVIAPRKVKNDSFSPPIHAKIPLILPPLCVIQLIFAVDFRAPPGQNPLFLSRPRPRYRSK